MKKRIKHITIPLIAVRVVSIITLPFNPFIKYIYCALKLLNNFPSEHKLQVLCGTHQLIKEKERRKKEREKRMKNL